MSDILHRFIAACEPVNAIAAPMGFPTFTAPFRHETALDSAPYVYGMAAFRAAFGTSTRRATLIARCEAALDDLRQGGVVAQALLVGGSFIRGAAAPSDLDALVVYSLDPEAEGADRVLATLPAAARADGVDLKFCPIDVHPVILVKRLIFFANVFSYARGTGSLDHGAVLLIPDGAMPAPSAPGAA